MVVNKRTQNRFWSKVSTAASYDDCWCWVAGKQSAGYGCFWDGERVVLAHRFSYVMHHGNIPEGLFVCHTCDNPACVNPAHLWVGTPAANARDKQSKGRCSSTSMKGSSNGNSRLTERDVLAIRAAYRDLGFSQRRLAQDYGVSQAVIWALLNGQTWRHV